MTRSNLAWVFAALALLSADAATAATPGQINYQGLLLDDQGDPVTGNVDFAFTIFDAPLGGSSLWTESHADVAVLDGVYDVVLGSVTPITPTVVAGGAIYLQIAVDGETLAPRQRLVAVPYAIRSQTADSVGDVDSAYISQIIEHVNFDGADPPNDDPSEGVADPDGDGRANFIDEDNDGDGLGDSAELAQQSDINLITPRIIDIQPEPAEAAATTPVTVTGANFEPGITVSFGSQNPTPQSVTATSFQVTVGPQPPGSVNVEVTRTNGESASTTFQFGTFQPTITAFDPPSLDALTGGNVTILGSGFQAGIAVTFGSESPTPTTVTPTSLVVAVGPQPVGPVDVTVFYPGPGGLSDTESFSFVDTSNTRRVFVTSTDYDGNLGGIAGANAKCAARAAAASLTGTYLAWLGAGTSDPDDNFTKPGNPYHLVNGTGLVAASYASLTDGTLDHPINRDEFGNSRAGGPWTNVNTNGTAMANSCSSWTSAAPVDQGRIGTTSSAASAWTVNGALGCNTLRPLYCFEQ